MTMEQEFVFWFWSAVALAAGLRVILMASDMDFSGGLKKSAMRHIACPRCGAVAGDRCKTPSGRITFAIHTERFAKLVHDHPESVLESIIRVDASGRSE